MAQSKPGIEVRLGTDPIVPGRPVTVEVVPQHFIDPCAVRADLSTVITNRLGVSVTVCRESVSVEVEERLVPGSAVRLDVPIPRHLPPPFRCSGGALLWRLSVSCGENRPVVEDLDVRPHPAEVPAAALVDDVMVEDQLDRNRRTASPVGSTLDLGLFLLALAVTALPAFLLVNGENAVASWVAASFVLGVVTSLAVRRFFGRPDRYPFDLVEPVVRSGRRATVCFATPLESGLAAAVLTRIETQKGADEGTRIVICWELGPVTALTPGTLVADVEVAPDAPTLGESTLRIDHWIRVQPEDGTRRSQGWVRRRSDRPVYVVA